MILNWQAEFPKSNEDILLRNIPPSQLKRNKRQKAHSFMDDFQWKNNCIFRLKQDYISGTYKWQRSDAEQPWFKILLHVEQNSLYISLSQSCRWLLYYANTRHFLKCYNTIKINWDNVLFFSFCKLR